MNGKLKEAKFNPSVVRIKCKLCGEVFEHYYPSQPTRSNGKKYCEGCIRLRASIANKKYLNKKKGES